MVAGGTTSCPVESEMACRRKFSPPEMLSLTKYIRPAVRSITGVLRMPITG